MTDRELLQNALVILDDGGNYSDWFEKFLDEIRTRLAQPEKEWVGLTDEEQEEIALELPIDAVRITEAKLKEKNAA